MSTLNERIHRQFHGTPDIEPEVYEMLGRDADTNLAELIWQQHCFHEFRRWNVTEKVRAIDLSRLTPRDKRFVRNAGIAELTTKPGADRLSNLADKECRRWSGRNAVLAAVMQALGTWSRYWNEEESHHETAFGYLMMAVDGFAPTDETIIEYRKIFPDDNMLRTLMVLVFSEITASVQYAHVAQQVSEAGLRSLLRQIAADEIQHMRYFVTFAKALVDSGEYGAKDAFAISHMYLREGGELYGSVREHPEDRDSHVNWWDHVESGFPDIDLGLGIDKKEKMIFNALERVSGIRVTSREEVENTWMDLVPC